MSQSIEIHTPFWAHNFWAPVECTIEPNTDGTFTIVDHSLQISIATGTREQCLKYLQNEREAVLAYEGNLK